MQLPGKGALITGGASGLGAATVCRLHAAGVRVLIADLDVDRGQALAAELGAGAQFCPTDVTREDSVQQALDLLRLGGGVHFAVNCAGILIGEKLLGRQGPHNLERFRRVIEVNLVGTFNVLRLAADAMRHNAPDNDGERGVIVNTVSIAAWEGQIGQCAYAASKAGIAGLILPAARELAGYGIRVCGIAPGIFDTAMIAGLPEEVKHSLGQQVPFPNRLGRPEEFAELVLHILSQPMLNGTTIRLDGALRMAAR